MACHESRLQVERGARRAGAGRAAGGSSPRRRQVHSRAPAAPLHARPMALLEDGRGTRPGDAFSPRFVDRAPAKVVATLLDEGQYLCSMNARCIGFWSCERAGARRLTFSSRASRSLHPQLPELVATAGEAKPGRWRRAHRRLLVEPKRSRRTFTCTCCSDIFEGAICGRVDRRRVRGRTAMRALTRARWPARSHRAQRAARRPRGQGIEPETLTLGAGHSGYSGLEPAR